MLKTCPLASYILNNLYWESFRNKLYKTLMDLLHQSPCLQVKLEINVSLLLYAVSFNKHVAIDAGFVRMTRSCVQPHRVAKLAARSKLHLSC